MMAIAEETLMAYADGELDTAEKAKVEAALAADPALSARLNRHLRLRERMAQAHGDVLSEPVPDALLAAIRKAPAASSAAIVDLAEVRARRAAPPPHPKVAWNRWGGLAACLVVGLAVSAAFMHQPNAPLIASTEDGLTARGALARALDDQLASSSSDNGGQPRKDGAIKIGVSFRTADHLYCRTFQVEHGAALAGVACREPGAWTIKATATSAPEPLAAGYRTAASPLPAPVTAAVEAMIAGAPLDASGEAAAKAARWRP